MSQPTIVLVHGAFADASSWAPVVRRLLERGYDVRAAAGPNRSLVGDAAYIRSVIEQIDGPVVLVGHSYGGAVIGIAGAAQNVVALVYAEGYVLEEGETIAQLQGRFPDSPLVPNLVFSPFPLGDSTGTDVSVKIDAFPEIFAIGVDPETARILAASQRPLAASVFEEPAPVAAWKTTPSWGIVSAGDRTINPDVERFGYERAGFRSVTELDAPHLSMYTHPEEVTQVILTAVAAVTEAD
ncbi:MAG: alpha/beta hydrolase [Microbacterium sp.]|uniref:alpha/beta fold hydrolase n=1 Tax=Microbacterium sp. TaxID=51671 RepID=UPI001AC23EAE|nr:alpha/beta hydrolase [Microbacterium sp.]MBN9154776.1 alpha/beta hydrolase [Microbacterium sp.]